MDVFNTQTGEWVQSIGVKRSKPLSFNGNLSSMNINDNLSIIYLANMHTREVLNTEKFLNREESIKAKRKFSLREINKTIRIGSDRRKLISGPTNFNHISHMGPEIQKQKFVDLPNTDQGSINEKLASRVSPCQVNLSSSKKSSTSSRYSSLPRSPSPLDNSASSLNISRERKSESRQSITSNISSSTPPSPNRLSSSYDS